MTEYSPWPGTFRSNTLEVTDEPCTKNNTGREGSPGLGAPSRLRYIHSGTSPFLAQYSPLQISPLGNRRLRTLRGHGICERPGNEAKTGALDDGTPRQMCIAIGHGFLPAGPDCCPGVRVAGA